MIQSLINFLYRHPIARLKQFQRFGGYINYHRMIRSQYEMIQASKHLPPVRSTPEGLPVYFLTGRKYLHQTLFCIRSLVQVSQVPFQFILVDDGSFDPQLIAQIQQQLPGAGIATREIIEQNLAARLPQAKYPVLHHKRAVYPHIRKLTDIHTLTGSDWKLVLDSDMLFCKTPAAMLTWLKQPEKPVYMQDCTESYGYTRQLMEDLCGQQIPPLLNVGAIGLNSSRLNWGDLENWTKILEEKEGSSYYLEQALTAMLLAGTDSIVLPADHYIVNPSPAAIAFQRGILHHYVDLSKEGFFKLAWKKHI